MAAIQRIPYEFTNVVTGKISWFFIMQLEWLRPWRRKNQQKQGSGEF